MVMPGTSITGFGAGFESFITFGYDPNAQVHFNEVVTFPLSLLLM